MWSVSVLETITARERQITPFLERVTLLGGGELSSATVSELLHYAPNLAVCDGAARQALEFGHMPLAVFGDMDSLDAETRARLDPARVHEISEQETTDFDKALRLIEAPLILGAGFMGKRLDHELACYNALVRHPDRRCILVGSYDICFHAPHDLRLDLDPGTRVSLFPMRSITVSAEGLLWPLDRLHLAPDGRVGTSNEALGPVDIHPAGPGLLVILPVAALERAIDALSPDA